jgi:GNAT superfamily N-acetyltransferase
VGSRAWQRFDRVMNVVEQVHHSVVTGPHWYLPLIGVEPSRQGHGVGATLLHAMLARCDVDDLPCYLETFQPTNVRLVLPAAWVRSRGGGHGVAKRSPLLGLQTRAERSGT